MPRFLLDATFCIDFLRGRDWARAALARVALTDVAVSAVTAGELHACAPGAEARDLADRFLGPLEILPYGLEEARRWGQVETRLLKHGEALEAVESMVAATALLHGLAVVTGNPKRYERVKGLKAVDWERHPPD
jgi:predicted nucleic acid-binding protein